MCKEGWLVVRRVKCPPADVWEQKMKKNRKKSNLGKRTFFDQCKCKDMTVARLWQTFGKLKDIFIRLFVSSPSFEICPSVHAVLHGTIMS